MVSLSWGSGVNIHWLRKWRASKGARFKTGPTVANKPEAGAKFYEVIRHAGYKEKDGQDLHLTRNQFGVPRNGKLMVSGRE